MREQEIYTEAMSREDPADRRHFLDEACGDDRGLRKRLENLIRHSDQVESFLESPPQPLTSTGEIPSIKESPGTQIGPYTIREQIGEGGMGAVYVAEQASPVRRKVALKIIKPGMDTRDVVARFDAERQALAMMDHPNIARILDAGATETGRPYFVMELVRGIPITHYCDQEKLSARPRLDLFVNVCHAIQHAHQKGIIHRDIKPSNVLVTLHDGVPVPKVIDFGIAKATQRELTAKTVYTRFQQFIGTPAYMSPEQAEMSGLDIDTRSDIYSLGVLAYELLTGVTPFDAKELMRSGLDEMRKIIREREPLRPSSRLTQEMETARNSGATQATVRVAHSAIDRDLDWIVMKCLEKDRTRRYATAGDLAADLRRYQENEPVVARPPSAVYRFQKAFRRNRLAYSAAAAVTLALLVGTGVSTWQAIRATQAENRLADAHGRVTAQRDRAIRAERDAKSDRDRAVASEQLASTRAEQLRRKVYAFHISRAADALDHDNFAKAKEYLGQCPEDLRHWEWQRLNWVARDTELFTLHGAERPLFTMDGEYILSADFRETRNFGQRGAYGYGDKTNAVVVWDAKTGERIGRLKGHLAPVASLAISADGQRLVTCDVRGEMILWDLSLGPMRARELHRWKAHHDKSDGLAFNPDATKIASVGWDGLLNVWDARSGSAGHCLFSRKVEYQLRGVSFNVDGTWLATSGYSSGPTTVWDVSTGEVVRLTSEAGGSGAVAFSPQGQLFAAGAGRDVEIWNTSTWKKHVLQGHRATVRDVAFSPQGDRLASCSLDGSIMLWDIPTARKLTTLGRHPDIVEWLSFSPDGERVASYSNTGIRVWDTVFKRHVLTLHGHEIHPHALAISRDQRLLVSSSCDGTVKVWDASSGMEVRTLRSDGERFWAVDVDDKGELLAAGGEDGTAIFVWQATTGQLVYRLKGHIEPVTSLSFRPGHAQLASASEDDTIRIWDLRTGKTTRILDDHSGNVNAVAFSRDGQRLASVGDDRRLYVRHAESDEPDIVVADQSAELETVAFSPDGSRLAVSCRDGAIAFYDASTGERLLTTRHGAERTLSLAFSPDAKRLFSGGSDGAVRVWNTSDGEQLLTLSGHDREVVTVVGMRGGTAIASASLDGSIKIWEAGPSQTEGTVDRGTVESARRIVDQRYDEHGFYTDVVESLRADASLDSATRSVALQIANARGERAWLLNSKSLDVVRQRGKGMEAYRVALRQAEAACSASPDSWRFMSTLGMALYRVGEYERALEVLQRAEGISKDAFGTSDPTILAFAAMALHRIGKSNAARETLEKAYSNSEENRWSMRANPEGVLAEAQRVFADVPRSAR